MSHVEIVKPQFIQMHWSDLVPVRVMHVYCLGGWAKLSCGGMNVDAAKEAFSGRPKKGFFSYASVPTGPEVLLFGFDAINFSGFSVENEGRSVYFKATKILPAAPYFSYPSDFFLKQIEKYNALHDRYSS
jgi:hypothetical protein